MSDFCRMDFSWSEKSILHNIGFQLGICAMDENILSVRNIYKSFGGAYALDNVDLDIRRGEAHCLAGENGSGKSTLIKIISGVYQADSGTLAIDGKKYAEITPVQSIEAGV